MKRIVLYGLFGLLLLDFMGIAVVKAQEVKSRVISGIVRNRDNRKELENVNVSVVGSNVGTVTNEDGVFSLKVSEEEISKGILVSHIGFLNVRLSSEELNRRGNGLVVWMNPSSQILQEVNVYGGSPRELVEKAISKIMVNYADKSNLYTAFYRETVQKGRRYIGVAEAVMNVYKSDYRYRNTARDRSQLVKGRRLVSQRAKDTLSVKLAGGPATPIYLDVVKNGADLLDISNLDYYDFVMEKPASLDNRMQYVVSFYPSVSLGYALYIGRFYIDQETLAFTRVEFEMDMSNKTKATSTILQKKPFGLRFRPIEVSYLVTYRQQNGKTYLNYIRNDVRFKCDWKKRLFSSTYTTTSEVVMVDREEAPVNGIKSKDAFKHYHVFDDVVDEYWEPDFWKDYTIIEPTESLESAVEKLRKLNR